MREVGRVDRQQLVVEKKDFLFLALIFDKNTSVEKKASVLFDVLDPFAKNINSDEKILMSSILQNGSFEQYLHLATDEKILQFMVWNPEKLCGYYSCVEDD